MNRINILLLRALLVIPLVVISTSAVAETAASVGMFDSHGDVGTVLHPGSAEYDAAKKTYTISGSGENVWFSADAFQFVWKKVSGDVALTADISLQGSGGNEHRKAVLMVRQTLDADAAYADVALHGNGLTSLQYRDEKGANHARDSGEYFRTQAAAPGKTRRLRLLVARRRGRRTQARGGVDSGSAHGRVLHRHWRLFPR